MITDSRSFATLLLATAVASYSACSGPRVPASDASEPALSWHDSIVGARVGLYEPVAEAEPDQEALARLAALGYLQGYEPPGVGAGIALYEPAVAQDGYNLYTSAHAPEARLVSMRGELLHAWSFTYADACPARELPPEVLGQRFWRRARLLPDGGVLAILDYAALIRLDRSSKLVWARCEPYHHDLDIDAEGTIYALRSEPTTLDLGGGERPIDADVIDVLAADGSLQRQIPLLRALADSPFRAHLHRAPKDDPEIFHTNAVRLLRGSITAPKAFAAGHLLVSIRNLDLVATIDAEREMVVWALSGMWRAQHDPVETDAATLLVFDNLARDGSRVLEIDPLTQRVVWSFEGGFSSPICGSNQRLANGNTLIVASTAGRAFEVTPERRIVWEFRSPHRVEREGEELVALLPALERIEPALVDGWLRRGD